MAFANRLEQLPFVLLLLFAWPCTAAGDTMRFFETWEKKMHVVRDEIQNRLNSTNVRNCQCSIHVCGDRPPDDICQCVPAPVEDLECSSPSCGHISISTGEAFVRTAPNVAAGSHVAEVKTDVCLMEGLADVFRVARREEAGFVPWSYFGTSETGTFLSWPGRLRDHDQNGKCRAYDPVSLCGYAGPPEWDLRGHVPVDRTYALDAEFYQKSIVKWELTLEIVSTFLRTLSEDDQIQVVLFDDTKAWTLRNDTRMLSAKEENVKSLIRELNSLAEPTPTASVDLGEALHTAVDLLLANDENTRCENHILVFADKRDCSTTILFTCKSKMHVNETFSEKATHPNDATISYAKELFDWNDHLNDRSSPLLFTFSLTGKANGQMSQLACALGGINVDLEKELSRGRLDPFQIMRGYFRRAAAPIHELYQERHSMTVTKWYRDDGGLGEVNTFVMPVFHKPFNVCPAIHYGIIGFDMTPPLYERQEVQWSEPGFDLTVDNWNGELNACVRSDMNVCQMQVLRGPEDQCIFRIDDKEKGAKCYRFKTKVYYVNDETEEQLNLDRALAFCEEHGGMVVAPMDDEEQLFLASVIPADGVWVNLIETDSNLEWPNGSAIPHAQRTRMERTCDHARPEGFFIDPRDAKDNIQCRQRYGNLSFVCEFSASDNPAVCQDLEIRRVTERDYRDTIKTCKMEGCPLENIPAEEYVQKAEGDLLCYGQSSTNNDQSHPACCSESQLQQSCPNPANVHTPASPWTAIVPLDQTGAVESVEDTADGDKKRSIGRNLLWILIVAGMSSLLFVALLVFFLFNSDLRYTSFRRLSKRPPQSSVDSSNPRRRPELASPEGHAARDSIRSPFENAPAVNHYSGKRPELVVNIEVKILDNGWEKVGGYGRVRQGEYTDGTGNVHRVAVKFVDALAPIDAWEALKNEFDILASIPLHPNIVKPIGAHWGDRTAKSQRYIVEEFMHTNLGDLLRGVDPHPYPDKRTMRYRDWIGIFVDIARGLEHLHQHKIIHFDLKPRNVLLCEAMRAKIADFGCSKSKFDTYIQLSKMAGTPPYLAPECWMLYYGQNHRAEVARIKIDVYSLGVIMWECLNGGNALATPLYRRAEAGASPSSPPSSPVHPDNIEIVRHSLSSEGTQHWEIQYHMSEEIHPGLRDLVTQCVRIDFDSRPTCTQILQTLEPMLDEEWAQRPVP